jgi:RimJ/RimL family protein N-acetyltransferase
MRIETARLILREFREDDWPAVLAYQSDPRYLRFYGWESRSPDEVKAFVAMFIRMQAETPRTKFQLAIETKADGRLIGNCGVRKSSPDAPVADMGYELSPDEWGRGYATEAATAIREFGFATLGIHRLWATCVPENTASARVLAKIGMTFEGRLRENNYYKGRWWDELIYGILEAEWRALPQGRSTHSSAKQES